VRPSTAMRPRRSATRKAMAAPRSPRRASRAHSVPASISICPRGPTRIVQSPGCSLARAQLSAASRMCSALVRNGSKPAYRPRHSPACALRGLSRPARPRPGPLASGRRPRRNPVGSPRRRRSATGCRAGPACAVDAVRPPTYPGPPAATHGRPQPSPQSGGLPPAAAQRNRLPGRDACPRCHLREPRHGVPPPPGGAALVYDGSSSDNQTEDSVFPGTFRAVQEERDSERIPS